MRLLEESRTVPRIDPVASWADAGNANINMRREAVRVEDMRSPRSAGCDSEDGPTSVNRREAGNQGLYSMRRGKISVM
jgi:hypothetical protein